MIRRCDFETERRRRQLSNAQPLFINWQAVCTGFVTLAIGIGFGMFVIFPLIQWLGARLHEWGLL